MQKFDYDKFNNMTPDECGRAIMHIVDRTQLKDHHVQVMASAGYFIMLCTHLKVNPQDAFTAFSNLLNRGSGNKAGLKAAQAYIKGEL